MSRPCASAGRIRLAVIAILVVCASAASAAAASAAVTATLTPATTFDFGNRQLGAGPSSTRTYTVRSTGTDPLAITGVSLTGADAGEFAIPTDNCSARDAGNPLAQDQTCTVLVAFDPEATGARTTTLEIATNGPTLTSAALAGTGRDLAISAASLDFGPRTVGTGSASQTVTITNEGDAAYTLGAVNFGGGAANQFAKTSDTCSATALAPAASCTVDVRFAPTTPGLKAATLTIAAYGPTPVTLAGLGTAAAAALSPVTRDFGVLATGAPFSAAQTFTLTNSGNDPLQVGTVALAGPDAAGFALSADGCSGRALAPGASCTVAVVFSAANAGWRTASLVLPTSGAVTPLVARLTGRRAGTGADTNPFLAPPTLGDQPLLRLRGDGGDTAGTILASGACDVNGDGFDDAIVGAPLWSRTPADLSWEGAAYVSFGGPSAGGADLANPPAGRVLLIEGEQPSSQTGAVGCAGDVNDDGVDDLLVGAWAYEYAGRAAGTPRGIAYVVFGARDLAEATPLDLGNLGPRGFRIEGPNLEEFDHLGYAVTGVGDLDGDGFDDIAVMANTADTTDAVPPRTNNGIVYVLRGKSGSQTVDASAAGARLMTIHGASPGSSATPFGQMSAFAALGDVDGDQVGDIGIGSYTTVAFGRSTASGSAFVISGRARGRIDLADPSAPLFAVGGAFAGHRLGIGIAAAGDMNDDGLADVAIGADSTSAANSDAAYVVFGDDAPAHELLDAADLGTRGYRVLGGPGTSTGYSVDGVGDVNRDGRDDLVVGAYGRAGAAGANSGAAWIVYGQDVTALPANDGTSGLVPANADDHTRYLSLASLTSDQGSKLEGQTAGERFGRQVASVGDVDGNGAADVAFGADQAFRHDRTAAGETTIALLPGPVPAYTPPVDPGPGPGPGQPPAATAQPRVTGSGHVGATLTCAQTGAWANGPVALAYAWLRAGKPIAGADDATYRAASGDVASLVACRVTATNGAGSTVATAAGLRVTQPTVVRNGVRTAQVGPGVARLKARSVTATDRGRLELGTVACVRARAVRCSVTATVTLRVGDERRVVKLRRTVARPGSVQLALALPAALRSALARGEKGTAEVRVTVRDDTGARGTKTQRIAVRRA